MPPGTTLRNVRVPDELWDAALARAENEYTNVSEVVRELLQQWVDR
jgi:Arc/MetJ-type ribon-helix-helix transcriptional regulator